MRRLDVLLVLHWQDLFFQIELLTGQLMHQAADARRSRMRLGGLDVPLLLEHVRVMFQEQAALLRCGQPVHRQPVRLIDPKTNEVFVLVRADVYERVRSLLEDDYDIRDTYPAQFAAAMRAGWGDPAMDDYDNFLLGKMRKG